MDEDFVLNCARRSTSVAYMDKQRTFSTSTPFFNGQGHKGLLPDSINNHDSGLGSSILDPSITSLANISEECHTINSCRTPKRYEAHNISIHVPDFNLSASPVSSKRHPFTVNSNFTSRKSFLTRRSLDSDFSCSGDESVDSGQRTVSLNQSRISRTVERSLVRKLDLDLDIYDNNVCDARLSVPSRPSEHEAVLSEKFNKIMQNITPIVGDRLIGRKMGREYVDIVSELDNRNIDCLSFILSFLDPQDLCRICQVSQQWRTVCERNTPADRRRRRFIRRCQRGGKENFGSAGHKRNLDLPSRSEAASLHHLRTIQYVADSQHQEHTQTTTEHFVQAASRLKNDEKLQKCPRCRMAAKVLPVQDRGKCLNTDCEFDFCIKCLCDFHGSKDCILIAKKKTKTDSIGTRKSKKNLKRL